MDDKTEFTIAYNGVSEVLSQEGIGKFKIFGNILRSPVGFNGKIKKPIEIREALSTLYSIVGSDYRYVPKDKTAYAAYLRMKQQSSAKNVWQAQQDYFDFLQQNDPEAWLILDPIITVHPDCVFFEVFSKDESTYANLKINNSAFEEQENSIFGTTNIDFSKNMYESIQRLRSYRETHLQINNQETRIKTDADEYVEKKINVPDSWLHGFLQVQSAAMLPKYSFSMAAIDFYNILRQLRFNADQKRKRKGMRVELIPGQKPKIVLEPWEVVIPTNSDIYKGMTNSYKDNENSQPNHPIAGREPQLIRVWGRRRLMLLRRMLPFIDTIDVHLLGSGLPSFFVLKSEHITLTLGLTGFTSSNWAKQVSFDLLLPKRSAKPSHLEPIIKHLSEVHFDTAQNIAQKLSIEHSEVIKSLQAACQHGKIMFDTDKNVYRYRPLSESVLDLTRLEYRNLKERKAYDLIAKETAVKVETIENIPALGTEVVGFVDVPDEKREYRPKITFSQEGLVKRAECTCSFYRKHKLKEGPCEHIIALRIKYALDEADRKARGDERQTSEIESRMYVKRFANHEQVYQLSLSKTKVKIRWGKRNEKMRAQNLVFNSVADARNSFFSQIDSLVNKGYLDATESN